MSSAGEELGGVWVLCLPQENPALFKGDLAFPIQVMLLLDSFPEPSLWSLLQRLHNIVKLRHGDKLGEEHGRGSEAWGKGGSQV